MKGRAVVGEETGYKPSAFNVFKCENGRYYASNTLLRSLVELEERHYRVLTGLDPLQRLSDEEQAVLVEEGLLVPLRLDEVALLRLSSNRGRFSTEFAELAIAPTMACNFACPYCFETPRPVKMSETVQDAVVGRVEALIDSGVRSLHISWYGGEPLLCPDIIESLSGRITSLCEGRGVPLTFSMTTNGYLLTEENVLMLQRSGINEVQVTLDGGREEHDRHRYLRDGGPTFDAIVSNIALLAPQGIRLHVRVNIDKGNPDGYAQVKSLLDKEGIERISVYPALIEQTRNQGADQRALCFGHDEAKDFYKGAVRAYQVQDGFEGMRFVACNCGAEHAYSMVIDPEGYVYRCWNDVGRPERAYASLLDEAWENPAELVVYLGRDPFTEQECATCPYIPLCLGGCLWEYLDKGTHSCASEKTLYWDILEENYLSENDEGGDTNEGHS